MNLFILHYKAMNGLKLIMVAMYRIKLYRKGQVRVKPCQKDVNVERHEKDKKGKRRRSEA